MFVVGRVGWFGCRFLVRGLVIGVLVISVEYLIDILIFLNYLIGFFFYFLISFSYFFVVYYFFVIY